MNDYTEGVEVPAEHNLLRTNDGRVFVDFASLAESNHLALHVVQGITEIMRGEQFWDGQHAFTLALHDQADDARQFVGLPPLAPEEDPAEAQAEVQSLEEAFGLLAFGEDGPDA